MILSTYLHAHAAMDYKITIKDLKIVPVKYLLSPALTFV